MQHSEKTKVLIVEDDREINGLLSKLLTKEGLEIVQAFDGKQAINRLELEGEFQLIILDLMMPYIDGFETIRRVRQNSNVPILVISAKDGEIDKISAISMGADDYIVKPFSINELTVRVKALLRRYLYFSNPREIKEEKINIKFKDLIIDYKDYSISKNGKSIKTTPMEFEILKLFLNSPKTVFTKNQIYDSVWGYDVIRNDNTVMVHVKRLRDKLGDEADKYIETVWGIGYKLGEDDE